MTKTFYITYWANKHKKHITRRGKHDEKADMVHLKMVFLTMYIMTQIVMDIELQLQLGK